MAADPPPISNVSIGRVGNETQKLTLQIGPNRLEVPTFAKTNSLSLE